MRYREFLITGGAGFIGSHLCRAAARAGARVTILDNLSRRGAEQNLALLREAVPGRKLLVADVRDAAAVLRAVESLPRGAAAVFHEASQVAVTTSVIDPRHDFEVNAMGTFNVLEAIRTTDRTIPFFFASSNKVYGDMEDVGIMLDEAAREYRYADLPHGVSETRRLDFHSPYGCSKGAADQYTIDYARIYGIPTVVFRQSCIYGTHQFGVEDQGWIAWFTIARELGRPVTIYGDGCQVRDVLWVEDLVEAYFAALERIDRCKGLAFNIGGGMGNRLTLLRLLENIDRASGSSAQPRFGDWRPGDQRVFVSDIRRAETLLGWRPRTSAAEGIARLHAWVREHRALLERVLDGSKPEEIVARAQAAAT